ncbi:MAG: two pore domain potassium channel family protein [Pseudomonadales bacterium]|nr:two pore domain potassium channel family protein [Pseudomonadales bacterium]
MLAAFLFNSLLVSVAVVIHYEVLRYLSTLVPRFTMRHRLRVLICVFGALCGHVLEIWLFGLGYFLLLHTTNMAAFSGNFDSSLLDCVYFSFTTYTTLGFGDIEPLGLVRFLVGLESLTGLVLITWTASFVYIEMRKFWGDS